MLKSIALSVLPTPVLRTLRRAKSAVANATVTPEQRWREDLLRHTQAMSEQYGPSKRECTLCGYRGLFGPFGYPVRPEVLCPECGSLERHRLMMLWMQANDRISGRSVLHFAPERKLGQLIRQRAGEYLSADREGHNNADMILDIEKIDRPSESHDVIVCSHVIEHVDDRAALAEMFRILRPGGLCLIMTYIVEGWPTYENPAVTTAHDRWLHFGQGDHVRFYGYDIRARIQSAGFSLSEFTGTGEEVVRYGLWRGERLFIAERPSASP